MASRFDFNRAIRSLLGSGGAAPSATKAVQEFYENEARKAQEQLRLDVYGSQISNLDNALNTANGVYQRATGGILPEAHNPNPTWSSSLPNTPLTGTVTLTPKPPRDERIEFLEDFIRAYMVQVEELQGKYGRLSNELNYAQIRGAEAIAFREFAEINFPEALEQFAVTRKVLARLTENTPDQTADASAPF